MTARETDPLWAEHVAEQNADHWRELRNTPYPGEVIETKPVSRFDETGACTYCGHTRDEHGEDKCGHLLAPNTCILCRCPFGKGTP